MEFRRRDNDIETHTEIAVSPEDDIELRRVRITNSSSERRVLDLTSYAEVVLASPAADALHPAFGNLFVQTEILREQQAILCTRRPRSVGRDSALDVSPDGRRVAPQSEEFLMKRIAQSSSAGEGRPRIHNLIRKPFPVRDGSVLDPIVAIRCRVTLDPEEVVSINIVSGIGETKTPMHGSDQQISRPAFCQSHI